MYKAHFIPFHNWKKIYTDYQQMEAFDNWLSLSISDDLFLNKKSRREYICALSYLSDELMEEGILIKGIFTLKLPFNSSDLISLIKRTDTMRKIFPDDFDVNLEDKENIFKTIRLYSAFLDFRELNPSEKNSYDIYSLEKNIPKKVRRKNKVFFGFTQILIIGLILFTVLLSWFFLESLKYKIIISIVGIIAILFDVFFLRRKYYFSYLENSLIKKNFIRVTADITDVFWEKSNIPGVKRLAVVEFTTPNNTSDERFYLYTFSSTPPKVGGKRYIPITFLYRHNLIIDGPFNLSPDEGAIASGRNGFK